MREPFTWKPLTQRDIHPTAGAYVEHVWLPKLGPTSTWLLRRLPILLASDPRTGDPYSGIGEPVYLDLAELALQLGVGEKTLCESRMRLVRNWLVGMTKDETWTVPALVPNLSGARLASLPAHLQTVEKTLRGMDKAVA